MAKNRVRVMFSFSKSVAYILGATTLNNDVGPGFGCLFFMFVL